MNMIQYEINRRDRAIEARDNTITQQGNTIVGLQAQLAELNEYRRRYGTLNGVNA